MFLSSLTMAVKGGEEVFSDVSRNGNVNLGGSFTHMVLVGLAGWGDHDSIYRKGIKSKDKLKEYSNKFPAWCSVVGSLIFLFSNEAILILTASRPLTWKMR